MKRSVSQEMAIKHGDGPCIVLSGPGSGKTFVLTNRVLNLIKEYDVSPENILVITFTRAAANEMKLRFIKLLKENELSIGEIPSFGTFHSIFFEILKNEFGYNSKSLLTEIEERAIISEVLENNSSIKVTNELISNYRAKDDGLSIYYVDMNDGLNKSHSTTEESNKNPNTVEDLSINGPTLIKVQAGKVINYIEGESEIRAILE